MMVAFGQQGSAGEFLGTGCSRDKRNRIEPAKRNKEETRNDAIGRNDEQRKKLRGGCPAETKPNPLP